MLGIVIAESALEPVPRDLWSRPAVSKHARLLGKGPGETLLDRSYHHSAMLRLEQAGKRGRPDIVHLCLLNALGTPLNSAGLLRVLVHTREDKVISISPETRLPRNYDRFVGLIEQLYKLGEVPDSGKPLLRIQDETLQHLTRRLGSSSVVILSRAGAKSTIQEVVKSILDEDTPLLFVGGFPTGRFAPDTLKLADNMFSIDPETLDAWIVVARVVYEYERAMGLPEKRWGAVSK
jgi:rRNA small subunit pseudouridine methyltransferase Nep1